MDEFTRHLLAKRDPGALKWAEYEAQMKRDPLLAAAHAKVFELAPQLQPHGRAFIELLNALAAAAGCCQKPGEREQTQFSLLWNAARVLGVTDRDIAMCTARLYGVDPTRIPDSFTFNDM